MRECLEKGLTTAAGLVQSHHDTWTKANWESNRSCYDAVKRATTAHSHSSNYRMYETTLDSAVIALTLGTIEQQCSGRSCVRRVYTANWKNDIFWDRVSHMCRDDVINGLSFLSMMLPSLCALVTLCSLTRWFFMDARTQHSWIHSFSLPMCPQKQSAQQ